eukprot:CAMPEP_0201680016 /NCGR_PEP_ID=MMETSP0494-20130426/49841_1 /ASSEMBLY_ACC=CAM_ASM_000839 /TAXON_ID=420259 /ORGANISM="Thalassiosira gravida, Strain GMp14c1" /LENGTH=90 /DNA_ID=CAMNT_0048163665 /DNA_START=422 /DNA_END=694 /DNA_ORIENTATION=-
MTKFSPVDRPHQRVVRQVEVHQVPKSENALGHGTGERVAVQTQLSELRQSYPEKVWDPADEAGVVFEDEIFNRGQKGKFGGDGSVEAGTV